MHTAGGNDRNEQMIVNIIDNFYLAITISNGKSPKFNHNILNSFIMIR